MLTIFTYLVTFLLIVDCLLLGLLILIQLPKKEAGVGVAFGGGAADALFGAGSGNALSNLTKYTAIAFFILVLALSVLNSRAPRSNDAELREQLLRASSAAPTMSAPATNNTRTTPTSTTTTTPAIPLSIGTNLAAPLTNAPAKK